MKKLSLQKIIPQIVACAKAVRGIDATFLFGSAARRRTHPESDLDLAVLYAKGLSAARCEALRQRFREGVEEIAGFHCDVIDLEEASTWLRYHVLKTGRCVYERNIRRCRYFIAQSLLDYFDFQPVYERMERRLLKRLEAA